MNQLFQATPHFSNTNNKLCFVSLTAFGVVFTFEAISLHNSKTALVIDKLNIKAQPSGMHRQAAEPFCACAMLINFDNFYKRDADLLDARLHARKHNPYVLIALE